MINIGARTKARFIVGEQSVEAEEALNGGLVINRLGNVSLHGFEKDPRSFLSSVVLDNTVEPPVLILEHALTTYVTGKINETSGEFEKDGVYEAPALVSGRYSGAGSELGVY